MSQRCAFKVLRVSEIDFNPLQDIAGYCRILQDIAGYKHGRYS